MNWKQFKQQLQANTALHLQFQYGHGSLVAPSYHITEIKQAAITSVDCGGVMNKWNEVIVQLWEPDEVQQERSMTAEKALAIIDLVERALPLDASATVKIEFGNTAFDTRQLLPDNIMITKDNITVNLQPDAVQCKAINRGGSCGPTPGHNQDCCSPSPKPKIKLVNLAATAESCTPGSGCC